ncbi:MAG TPA: diguanylate cyclase, partial [Actinomycetota bacterium]|nr:diguanylate cyclase [Actinomycetota bacterium]
MGVDERGEHRAMRVVIADDAAASRLLMRHTLQNSGAFEVVGEAADGLEAVDLAARHQPDLVLLDLIMPRLDGSEAVARIRQASPSSRIIVLSGVSAPDLASTPAGSALAAVDGGIDGYLEKRQTADEILKALMVVCSSPAGSTPSLPAPATSAKPEAAEAGAAGQPPASEEPTGAERELEQARADLALIGAAASHDLKSPLQAIMGFAHLLDQLYADVLDERGRTFVNAILDASDRMTGLVEGLAAYCRAIAVPPAAVRVSLEQVATAVLQAMEVDVEQAGATVVLGELPEVVGDPDQLALVLSSLLASALAWTPVDASLPEVTISADRAARGWTISVVDRGPGIETGHRERAFTRFGRLPGRVPGTGGAGTSVLRAGASPGEAARNADRASASTGLALARRLVEGWGGSIWVEDVIGDGEGEGGQSAGTGPAGTGPAGTEEAGTEEAGEAVSRGCRIRFVIPDRMASATPSPAPAGRPASAGERPRWPASAARPPAELPPERAREEAGGDAAPSLLGAAQQLLLVEDSEPHAHLVAATLAEAQGARYRLRHVTDLRQARRALREQHVDLVLLDLSLPDSEGLETLERMVQMAPGIPVVVLTSRSDEGLAVSSVQQGAQDYLVKGAYEPASLARSIRYAIERKALEAQLAQQALHDALTSLPNRTLLLERLNPALARGARTGDKLALLYLDLDGFKPINDEFGHDAGDAVLVEVSRRLRAVVRPQDTVARIGGDEFAVMCEGFRSDTEIRSLVSRMEDAIAQPIQIGGAGGEERRVTASIGIAFASGAEMSAEDLIRSADQAMYRVKRGDA